MMATPDLFLTVANVSGLLLRSFPVQATTIPTSTGTPHCFRSGNGGEGEIHTERTRQSSTSDSGRRRFTQLDPKKGMNMDEKWWIRPIIKDHCSIYHDLCIIYHCLSSCYITQIPEVSNHRPQMIWVVVAQKPLTNHTWDYPSILGMTVVVTCQCKRHKHSRCLICC